MALVPTFTPSVAGTGPALTGAAAGDTAPVGDRLYLIVRNTDAATRTVTFATPGNLPTGDAYPDRQYTVPATNGELWIPLLRDYADPTDGLAHMTWSATTNVTRVVARV